MAQDWLPMYWGKYLSKTGHLTALEHGYYVQLLAHYYLRNKPFTADEAARILKLSPDQKSNWLSFGLVLDEFFPASEGGLRRNKTADEQIHKAETIINARKMAGKKGGRPRKANALANEKQMVTHGHMDISIKKERKEEMSFQEFLNSHYGGDIPDDWVEFMQNTYRVTSQAAWKHANKCKWYYTEGDGKDRTHRPDQWSGIFINFFKPRKK